MQPVSAREIVNRLEAAFPPFLQENWDNSGFQAGDPDTPVNEVLLCLDITESVIQEALAKGCNLIISHHPLIFKPLHSVTGKTEAERVVISAIRHGLVLYSLHTNIDRHYQGVSRKMAEMLGLKNIKVLSPAEGLLLKLVIFSPGQDVLKVQKALFSAGAGKIGFYDEASFNAGGVGTFRPLDGANPALGAIGKRQQTAEVRTEVLIRKWQLEAVLAAVKAVHSYEEVAYDVVPLMNVDQDHGYGCIGELETPLLPVELLGRIKSVFGGIVRHTALPSAPVQKVALCGGSGSFLINEARALGAQLFLTADLKYHQFFEANKYFILADIGHYESEQFSMQIFRDKLKDNFPIFALPITETTTNPIVYF